MRQCGGCTLCCRLVPVKSLGKPAGSRCKHQRYGKGCAVHARLASISPECRAWNCRWLLNLDTADLARPDRSHFVIDVALDFIELTDQATGLTRNIPVVQVWADPKHRDAWNCDPLRAFIERRGREGIAALVRFNSHTAVAVIPPGVVDGTWHVVNSAMNLPEHSVEQIAAAIGGVVVPLGEGEHEESTRRNGGRP